MELEIGCAVSKNSPEAGLLQKQPIRKTIYVFFLLQYGLYYTYLLLLTQVYVNFW